MRRFFLAICPSGSIGGVAADFFTNHEDQHRLEFHVACPPLPILSV
jgi:hypothetical protein